MAQDKMQSSNKTVTYQVWVGYIVCTLYQALKQRGMLNERVNLVSLTREVRFWPELQEWYDMGMTVEDVWELKGVQFDDETARKEA